MYADGRVDCVGMVVRVLLLRLDGRVVFVGSVAPFPRFVERLVSAG